MASEADPYQDAVSGMTRTNALVSL